MDYLFRTTFDRHSLKESPAIPCLGALPQKTADGCIKKENDRWKS